jgi:hypothetical protein
MAIIDWFKIIADQVCFFKLKVALKCLFAAELVEV